MSRLLAPALLLAAACATAPRGAPLAMGSPPPTSVDLASAYQPEGEVFATYGRGAGVANSYGRNRVVGPGTSLSRNLEGRWGGTLSGHSVLLDVAVLRLAGAAVDVPDVAMPQWLLAFLGALPETP